MSVKRSRPHMVRNELALVVGTVSVANDEGRMPTVREVAEALGVTHGRAKWLIRRLVNSGAIVRGHGGYLARRMVCGLCGRGCACKSAFTGAGQKGAVA